MVECYKAIQENYEWLDIFNRKGRSDGTTMIIKRSSLFQQLHTVPGGQYDIRKVTVYKDVKSQYLADLIINEKEDGLFVALLNDHN